jgi:rhodanese-related sulfurtransferase
MDRFRKALRQGLLLILLGLALGLGANEVRHDGLPLLGRPAPQEITTVTVGEAWKLYQQGKAVFLDAREAEIYRSAHLPGAVHVTVESAVGRRADLMKLAEGNRLLITYCDGQGCGKARDLATVLIAERIREVAEMPDGWQGWMEAGFPIEEGRQ